MMNTQSVRWSIRKERMRSGDTRYEGEILVPGNWFGVIQGAPPGISYLSAKSAPATHPTLAPSTPGQALQQAGSIANDILGNPLVQAALPPGAGVAVAAIDYLAQNETIGNLANAAKDVVGAGAGRIVDALKFW